LPALDDLTDHVGVDRAGPTNQHGPLA
jgi:hypothetical protein